METTQEYLMDSYFNDKDIYTLDEFGDIKEIRDPEEVKRSCNDLLG